MFKVDEIPPSVFLTEKLYQLVDTEIKAEQKQVVVLYNYTTQDKNFKYEIPESDTILLNKILQAIQVLPNQTLVLNIANKALAITFAQLQQNIAPKYIIGFGISPNQIHLQVNIEYYQPLNFRECNLILSHSLATIAADSDKKKQLWTSLKKMFDI